MDWPSFKETHPDYLGYQSTDLAVSTLPTGFASALQGHIVAGCSSNAQNLKHIMNTMAGKIPTSPTTNWGWDFLIGELDYYSRELCKKPFPTVMDFLFEISVNDSGGITVKRTNQFLEELGVGYQIVGDLPYLYEWALIEGVESKVTGIDEAAKAVTDVCDQTLSHLAQAKQQLVSNSSERGRKDAVRDCLSAMEALLKKLSGKTSIDQAVKALVNSDDWGAEHTIKHGHKLWSMMHQYYPDMRHGHPVNSSLSEQEALYWVDCITNYVTYLARVRSIK